MTHIANESVRLLVVSRELSVLRPLSSIAESQSWQLESVSNGWEALERIRSGVAPDVLVLELPSGNVADTLQVLRWFRRVRPELQIVLVSDREDSSVEEAAIRLGAKAFLVWPFDEKSFQNALCGHLNSTGHLRTEVLFDDVEQLGDDMFFVNASPAMQTLRRQAELLARADVPVLIIGESGSGRNTIARLIHRLSIRSGFKFLRDRELFQDEAFSENSVHLSTAKLAGCDRGTIFLEGLASIPVSLQERFLQILQEKQFRVAEAQSPVDIDVQIIAAVDMNVELPLAQKKLCEDLYYRLSAFTVHVPALRQRKSEIPILLKHFMQKFARHYGLPVREFSAALLEACQRYSWPGNVKELESFVKRYLLVGDEELLAGSPRADQWRIPVRPSIEPSLASRSGHTFGSGWETRSLKSLLQDLKSEAERNAIASALQKTGWNRKAAARLLKVSYRSMLYKIEQYHISSGEFYTSPLVVADGPNGNGQGLKINGRRFNH